MSEDSQVVSIHPIDSAAEDVDALLARVALLQSCQRSEDVDGFLELFDDSAVWVNGAGRRLIGWPVIAEFTRQVLPGAFANGSVNYVVEHILFIKPDVALTGVDQEYVDLEGRSTGDAGKPSYVWVKNDGVWKIWVGQNTAVYADESVND